MRFLLLCLAFTASCRAQQPHTEAEQYLFDAVNGARASAGLPALVWNDGLSRAASDHADRMRKEDMLAHAFEGEAAIPERAAAMGVRFSAISENVAVAGSAVELHRAWMESSDHRANILDPQMTAIGISLHGNTGDMWGVEDFARVDADLPLSEQEHRVTALLHNQGVRQVSEGQSARDVCRGGHGAAAQGAAMIMRFTSGDLSHLPRQLSTRIAQGGVSAAVVGACPASASGAFTLYSMAVVLYR